MKRLILYSLFLLSLQVHGQTVLNSSSEAIELAKKNNRDIRISESRTAIEKENRRVTNSTFLPQIKGVSNLEYNYALPVQLIPAEFLGGREGDYRKVQFGTKYNWTAGLEASMPLVNGSLWADSKISKMNYEAAQQNYRNTEFEVLKQVTRGYYLTLLTEKSLAITKENLKIADSLKQIADQKLKNGIMEPLDYNRITTSWLRAKNDVERNQAAYINNHNSLKYYLGLNQNDSLILKEELKEVSGPAALTANPDLYPSVREKRLLASSSMWSMRRERYKRLPELSLYGRYLAQAQRNEVNFFNPDLPWYSIGVVGARLEVPIFTGLVRKGNINKLEYRYDIQQKELEKEIQKVKIEDQELLNNYNNSSYAAENLKESFKLSESNIQIAMLKYKEGLFSLDQYLNVFNESLSVQSQYLNALSELYTTRTIIELKNNLQ